MINLIDSYKLVIIRWATLIFSVLYSIAIVYGVYCMIYAIYMLYACIYCITYAANRSTTFVYSLIPFVMFHIFINGFMSVTYVYIFLFISYIYFELRIDVSANDKKNRSFYAKDFLFHFLNIKCIQEEKKYKKYKKFAGFFFIRKASRTFSKFRWCERSVCITLSKTESNKNV